jgi:DNA-binding transcriptional LysR family regulator
MTGSALGWCTRSLPNNHRLAGADRIRLADLNDTALVVFDAVDAPGFHDQIIHLCRTAGYTPATTLSASQMTTMLALVAASGGFALVPRSARRLAIAGVAFRPLLDDSPSVDLYAAWSSDRETRLVEALLALLDPPRSVWAADGANRI